MEKSKIDQLVALNKTVRVADLGKDVEVSWDSPEETNRQGVRGDADWAFSVALERLTKLKGG